MQTNQSKHEASLDIEPHATPEDFDEGEYDLFDDLNANYYTAVATDEYDNIYTTHNTHGTATLYKRDPYGNMIYSIDVSAAMKERSLIYSITPDLKGNIYLVGARANLTHLEASDSNDNLQAAIYKYSTNGQLLWSRYHRTKDDSRFIESTYVNDSIYAIALLPPMDDGFETSYIAAYNSRGKLQCSNSSPIVSNGEQIYIMDLQHDSQGNIYIAGAINNTKSNKTEAYITKLTPTLSLVCQHNQHHLHETCYTSIMIHKDIFYASASITKDAMKTTISTLVDKYEYTYDIKLDSSIINMQQSIISVMKQNDTCSDNSRMYAVLISSNSPVPELVRLDKPTFPLIDIPGINGYKLDTNTVSVCLDGSIVLAGERLSNNKDDLESMPFLVKYDKQMNLEWSRH
jgi:hypothetical protein